MLRHCFSFQVFQPTILFQTNDNHLILNIQLTKPLTTFKRALLYHELLNCLSLFLISRESCLPSSVLTRYSKNSSTPTTLKKYSWTSPDLDGGQVNNWFLETGVINLNPCLDSRYPKLGSLISRDRIRAFRQSFFLVIGWRSWGFTSQRSPVQVRPGPPEFCLEPRPICCWAEEDTCRVLNGEWQG